MLQISGGDIKEIQGSRQNKFALSLSESSVVAPRASHFFVWQWAAVRRKKGRSKSDRVLRQAPRITDCPLPMYQRGSDSVFVVHRY